MNSRGLERHVCSLNTQTLVDLNDSAFNNPTKPIGAFLSKQEAEIQAEKTGLKYIEDSGRGYRLVVPSPRPVKILDQNIINDMVSLGYIVVASGGGGVPVVKNEAGYSSVAGVIDKDLSASKIASALKADIFIIITAVENVYINFNSRNQIVLSHITIDEVKNYINQNQFASGSMLPKIEACVQFIESNPKGVSIITSTNSVMDSVNGTAGTRITMK